jgi:hypothetical protein
MRRPNPWIVIPALSVGLLVGWLGWIATDISCRADQPVGNPGCPAVATAIGIVCFVGATIGLIVVLALTGRSIAEYRDEKDRDSEL